MKKFSFVLLIFGLLFYGASISYASLVTGSFSGTISDSLTRGSAVIPGGIVNGDPFTLNFSYNTDIATRSLSELTITSLCIVDQADVTG